MLVISVGKKVELVMEKVVVMMVRMFVGWLEVIVVVVSVVVSSRVLDSVIWCVCEVLGLMVLK